MKSLTQIQEIFAGLYNIYIVESEGVIFDDIILGELQGITLESGYDYIKIPFVVNTADYTGKSNLKKIAYKDNKVELFIATTQTQELTELDGKTYILLLEDRLNQFWCLGTPEMPLHFYDNYSTGKSGADSSGHKIVFEQKSRLMLLSLESSPLDYDTLAFHIGSTEFVDFNVDFNTTEPGYIYCRYSDGRTWNVYCDLDGGIYKGSLAFPLNETGVFEITGGYEILKTINIYGEKVTQVDNLRLVPDLYDLVLNINEIETIDISALTVLYRLSMPGNHLTAILFPANTTLELLNLSSNPITNIDLNNIPNVIDITLNDTSLSSVDLSVLNFAKNGIDIDLSNNNFNQAAIDQVISDILTTIQSTGSTGILDISGNVAPSATGLANIATLETTYGWTVTHD